MEVLTAIRNWSEVWSLLIPLAIIAFFKFENRTIKPIILYVVLAFIINTIATIMFVYYREMPWFLKNNNVLYNIHSVLRVCLFGWYILSVHNESYSLLSKIISTAYIAFVLINFLFYESLWFFSSRLFSAESIVLLALCVSFFIRSIKDESNTDWIKHPTFVICAGLGFYETTNFFIFLFFYPLLESDKEFGKLTWTIHNLTFVIFCIMIALGLFRSCDKRNLPEGKFAEQ
jgi:hypothetical protein